MNARASAVSMASSSSIARTSATGLSCTPGRSRNRAIRTVAAGSVAEVHCYHPQPYYDPAQVHRRLITPEFLALVHRALAAGGRFGVGTDSNVLIDAAGELRQLEYAQRLVARCRNVLAAGDTPSVGRTLFDAALPADRRTPLARPAWNTLAVPGPPAA